MLVSLLVIVFTLLLSACGSTPEQPVEIEVTRIVAGTPEVIMITPTPEVVEVKPFRVAIVMPSSITDAAFSQYIGRAHV